MEGSESNGKISLEGLEIEDSRNNTTHRNSPDSRAQSQTDYEFHSTSALEILRECARILRYNCGGLMTISALLICPVSAVQLFSLFSDSSIVKSLTLKLMLIVKTSGLPLSPLVKLSCQRLSEMTISTGVCFPLYATLLLLSKSAVIHSVDCTYSKKQFDASKFCVMVKKLWARILATYSCGCMMIIGIVILFLVLLFATCNVFLMVGFSSGFLIYPGIVGCLVFSVVFMRAIIVCNVAVVVSNLEDSWGLEALGRSNFLIKGQIQVGIWMYAWSTLGMAFVQGLFDHRVKTLSYGDGSSRIWEGPLLVVMYSFVVLIDSMMTAVFYFSCLSFSMEAENEEDEPILGMATSTPSATSVYSE